MASEFVEHLPDPQTELLWLLQQCQDGVPEAIQLLVTKFYPEVYALAYHLSGQDEMARRLTRSALASALQWLPRYHGEPPFSFWLRRMLVRLARNEWERPVVGGSTPGPRRVDRLPPLPRLAFLLSELPEYDLPQVARLMNLSESQAAGHLEAARTGLEGLPAEDFQETPTPTAPAPAWTEEESAEIAAQVIDEAGRRKRTFRTVIYLAEAAWLVMGAMLLVGAALVFDLFGAPVQGAPAGSSTPIAWGLTLTLQPALSLTPTPTPFPYEGTQANAPSSEAAISADGRFVVFVSQASNLVPGDTNQAADVFLLDRETGKIERVSITDDGRQADGASSGPSISADGRYLAFVSWASNLVPEDTNRCTLMTKEMGSCADVFLRDRLANRTVRVSLAEGGQTDGHSGYLVEAGGWLHAMTSLADDGQRVVFYSNAPNLGGRQPGGLFVRDLASGETRQVDLSVDGQPGNNISFGGVLSADGRYVTFYSFASNLHPDDQNDFADIYLRDLETNELFLVTAGLSSQGGDGHSIAPALSGGGRYIVFRSAATNLVEGDVNGFEDIFTYDRESGQTRLASRSVHGPQTNNNSLGPDIAAESRYLAFASLASNLVDGDLNSAGDVFLMDRLSGWVELLSRGEGGLGADGWSAQPGISADGRWVVFVSAATNLTTDDVNGVADIFLYDRSFGSLRRVNIPAPDRSSRKAAPVVTTTSLPGPGVTGTPPEAATPSLVPVSTLSTTPTPTATPSPTVAIQNTPTPTVTPPTPYP